MGDAFRRQLRGYRRQAVAAYEAELIEGFKRELADLREDLGREQAETQRLTEQVAAREAELRDAAVRGTQSLRRALQSPYESVQTLQEAMRQQVHRRQQLEAEVERGQQALAVVYRLHAQLAAALQLTAEQYAEAMAAEQAAGREGSV